MSEFFRLIAIFLYIVVIITAMNISIEVSVLKGRGKKFGFLFTGLPFFLGIFVYVFFDMVIGTLRGVDTIAPYFTLVLWTVGLILSVVPIYIVTPTAERANQINALKRIISPKEIGIRFLIYLQLTAMVTIILIPVIWVIGASFSPRGGIGWRIWPEQLSLHQYRELLVNKIPGTERPNYEFVNWYKNTLMVAVATCFFSVIFITMVGYVFARFKFKGKKFGLLSILVLQMFPSFMGLIALYNLFVVFGLNNRPLALTFVYVSGAIPYNVWLVKGYLQNIPKSLDESAMIDGASQIQIFTKIIFPLASPIITFLAITMFMSPWMDFMLPRMVISSNNKQTLAIGLYNLINNQAQNFTLFAAGALLVALPITILYTLLQRYLIEGITAGANKG